MKYMKHNSFTIIYVPGLGVQNDTIRRVALQLWSLIGRVDVIFVPMKWRDPNEQYENKRDRIIQAIQQVASQHSVVLVGESAGGAMTMALLRSFPHKIHTVVTLCGKNQHASRVSSAIYRQNPAFHDAMTAADNAVTHFSHEERTRIITFYSPYDTVVPPKDSLIDGATHKAILFPGHIPTVVYLLFLRFPLIIASIKHHRL
jgi:predicted peptidase